MFSVTLFSISCPTLLIVMYNRVPNAKFEIRINIKDIPTRRPTNTYPRKIQHIYSPPFRFLLR